VLLEQYVFRKKGSSHELVDVKVLRKIIMVKRWRILWKLAMDLLIFESTYYHGCVMGILGVLILEG
jgi:hypothetical protein